MNSGNLAALVDAQSLIDEAASLYAGGGLKRGDSTGWRALDACYTVAPGQWTAITGIPGSGKSEFLDAMLVNLAEAGDWEFCLYSPENYPTSTHLVKLVEKRVRKPFSADHPGEPRMTLGEFRKAAAWVAEHFFWIEPDLKAPDAMIEQGLRFRQRGKKFGIVLDPWNTLDHQRGQLNETDYVSFILTEVTKLARTSKAHVWLVVHPVKLPRNKDGTRPVPTPYDMSGSAHWYNKSDNILTVHRDQTDHASQNVEIHVQKIRFKHIGKAGRAVDLKYAHATGRYFEAPTVIDRATGKPECYAAPIDMPGKDQ